MMPIKCHKCGEWKRLYYAFGQSYWWCKCERSSNSYRTLTNTTKEHEIEPLASNRTEVRNNGNQ